MAAAERGSKGCPDEGGSGLDDQQGGDENGGDDDSCLDIDPAVLPPELILDLIDAIHSGIRRWPRMRMNMADLCSQKAIVRIGTQIFSEFGRRVSLEAFVRTAVDMCLEQDIELMFDLEECVDGLVVVGRCEGGGGQEVKQEDDGGLRVGEEDDDGPSEGFGYGFSRQVVDYGGGGVLGPDGYDDGISETGRLVAAEMLADLGVELDGAMVGGDHLGDFVKEEPTSRNRESPPSVTVDGRRHQDDEPLRPKTRSRSRGREMPPSDGLGRSARRGDFVKEEEPSSRRTELPSVDGRHHHDQDERLQQPRRTTSRSRGLEEPPSSSDLRGQSTMHRDERIRTSTRSRSRGRKPLSDGRGRSARSPHHHREGLGGGGGGGGGRPSPREQEGQRDHSTSWSTSTRRRGGGARARGRRGGRNRGGGRAKKTRGSRSADSRAWATTSSWPPAAAPIKDISGSVIGEGLELYVLRGGIPCVMLEKSSIFGQFAGWLLQNVLDTGNKVESLYSDCERDDPVANQALKELRQRKLFNSAEYEPWTVYSKDLDCIAIGMNGKRSVAFALVCAWLLRGHDIWSAASWKECTVDLRDALEWLRRRLWSIL